MSKTIYFFNHKTKYSLKEKKRTIKWIEEAIISSGRIVGNINFIFTTDQELQKINIGYLNKDTYTDIITFDFADEPGLISGDIYISIERVKENAKKYRIIFEKELNRIIIHGVLHLMGYDDGTVKERKKMTSMENKFLKLV